MQSTYAALFRLARSSPNTLILDTGGRHVAVYIFRIKPVTVECGLNDRILSTQESHHPGRVHPLPALKVENFGCV